MPLRRRGGTGQLPRHRPSDTPEPHGSRTSSVEAPNSRDPCLPTQDRPLGYVDIFVDDFLTLAQGKLNRKRVRKILMQAIDQVIRPLQVKPQIQQHDESPFPSRNYYKVIAHGVK